MPPKLKAIKPNRMSDQVFEQLRELVFRGHLKPGERLMSERDLAKQLGVSRPTVRNAISRLVFTGILEHTQGKGTFVRDRYSRMSNPMAIAMGARESSLKDLLEVRMGLECNAAALAAKRADEEDIRVLEDCIKEIREELLLGRLGAEADVSFHMAISYATKNPAQVHLMKNFYDFLFLGIEKSLLHLYEETTQIEVIREHHNKIVDAIRNHDPEGAFNAMKHHISHVMAFFDARR